MEMFIRPLALMLTWFALSNVAQAIERNVTVNGGSMTTPVGVGFGHWEELEPLTIHLSADPGEVSHSEMHLSEGVIWNPIDSSQPDPWSFETVDIYPDEAFSAVFKGSIAGGGGPGSSQWAATVSRIDVDCDSLNAYNGLYREPDVDDAEADQVEYAQGLDAEQGGMTMSLTEGWAKLVVRANIKRASTFRLTADTLGLESFDVADSGFALITSTNADGTDTILFEDEVDSEDGPWTFYIRPKGSASISSCITIATKLIALGEGDSDDETKTAEDIVFIAIENNADIVKVEFVSRDELDLSDNPNEDNYGELQKNTNPNGSLTDAGNKNRHQLIEPAYQGGDRFFPDAVIGDTETGRNIVRVRATVENMSVGDTVLFRSFDVDDPSDDQYERADYKKIIDSNGGMGLDNTGRVSGSNHQPLSGSPTSPTGRWSGKLRSVDIDDGDEVFSEFKPLHAIVPAKVKPLIVGGQVQNDMNGDPILIAEVDLLTTFAPGDNFRVLAVPEHQRPEIKSYHIGAPKGSGPDKFRVPTNGDNKYFTRQLAVWRHLYVENDATAALYGLMGPGVTRQTNRLADAFIEPNLEVLNTQAINTSIPTVLVNALRVDRTDDNKVHEDDLAKIEEARQSTSLESPCFWVVYATDVYPRVITNPPFDPAATPTGYTVLNGGAPKHQSSTVFVTFIAEKYPAPLREIVAQKTMLHEVGHQLLTPGGTASDDESGHRGEASDVTAYKQEDEAYQLNPLRMNEMNVMNAATVDVPLNTPPVGPGDPGDGPKDWFFFHVYDVIKMRKIHQP